MKTIFFGSSRFVLPIIEVLHKNFDLCLVVTTERSASDSVPAFCKKNNIPYVSIEKFDDSMVTQIQNCRAKVGILGYFGILLPRKILDIFPMGIINTHPSLLPIYRGPTPVQTAIFNSDKKTGMTIIKLDNEIDHGPVLAQESEEIKEDDTTDSLHERLFKIGAELISTLLKKMEKDERLEEKSQDHSLATFTKPLNRSDGYIDVSDPKPNNLQNMIRAYHPWPGVWTRLRLSSGGQARDMIVKLLPNQLIQVEGKRPMNYKDFINGYPEGRQILADLQLL